MADTFTVGTESSALEYLFTPAALISNFIPLVVILGEPKQRPVHFEYKMWNVLSPLVDDENAHLLHALSEEFSEEYECEEHLYFYAQGRAASRAMYEGVKSGANAVVAHHPDVNHFFDYLKSMPALDVAKGTIFYLCFGEDTPVSDQEKLMLWCEQGGIKADVSHCVYEDTPEEQIKKSLNFLEKMVSQI